MRNRRDQAVPGLAQQAYALYARSYLYQYQGMKMKYMWHIVMPCLPIILYSILSALDVFGGGASGPPRAITISVGITFYYLFSETIVGFSSVLELNKSYITKTGVSFKACYISILYSVYSNFVIRFIVILGLLISYEIPYSIGIIYAIPYSVFPILVGASIGLMLSIFTVFYKDFNNFVQTVAFYMLFGSGVFGKIDGDSLFERMFINMPTYVTVSNAKSLILVDLPFEPTKVAIWVAICSLVCVISMIAIRNSRSLVINYLR